MRLAEFSTASLKTPGLKQGRHLCYMRLFRGEESSQRRKVLGWFKLRVDWILANMKASNSETPIIMADPGWLMFSRNWTFSFLDFLFSWWHWWSFMKALVKILKCSIPFQNSYNSANEPEPAHLWDLVRHARAPRTGRTIFSPTSLCGVLVFDSVSRVPPPALPHSSRTHTQT